MPKGPYRRLKHYAPVSLDLLEQRVLLSGGLIFVTNYDNGTIGEYTTSGETVNASLVSGLHGPWGIAVSGSDLFVVNRETGTVGKYTTSGETVNASLITGLLGPTGIAVSGSNLFVLNAAVGSIGEYTTSGATVNASLISGLGMPVSIAASGSSLFVGIDSKSTTYRYNRGKIGKYTTSGATVNASLISLYTDESPYSMVASGSNLFVATSQNYISVMGGPTVFGGIKAYTTSGAVTNTGLVGTLDGHKSYGMASFGSNLFLTSYTAGTIREYTMWGAEVNTSLVSGLSSPRGIAVTDVPADTWPTNLTLAPSRVAEHQPAGATVGTLLGTDPNVGDTFTYRLVSGAAYPDNASFTIVGDQFNTTAELNYEAKSGYSIRVRVTDQTGLGFTKTLAVGVKNINETPTSLGISARKIAENMPGGTVVGAFSTTDPDIGNTFAYTLADGGVDNAAFTITANGRLKTNQSFDFETKGSYSISVRSTDLAGESCERLITIRVADVNESPTGVALTNYSVMQHLPAGTLVGKLGGTDPDANNTLAYTLVGGIGSRDNAMFSILGGRLQTAGRFDYATKSVYKIRVRVTDQNGLWYEKTLAVGVTQ